MTTCLAPIGARYADPADLWHRNTLAIAFVTTLVAFALGTFLGLLAALGRGPTC